MLEQPGALQIIFAVVSGTQQEVPFHYGTGILEYFIYIHRFNLIYYFNHGLSALSIFSIYRSIVFPISFPAVMDLPAIIKSAPADIASEGVLILF